ncbi:FtsX-like permease family protein, partial [Candidatus Saccharibacteria bacterium]|nr:FtsX-like permease family protein [Candidatus Saccharibacteria bacterium]
NIKLRVSGVLKEGSSNNESMTQGNPDNILLVPFSVESDNTTKFLYSAILTKVNKVDNVTSAKQMITDSLKRFDQDKEYKVQSQDEVLGSTKTVLAILSSLIFVIAVIAVIMSGIGIMNVMIVAVTDRTKEIGIRKTVGATSKNIFWQFSVEAIMMTLVGGLIGVILSVVASFIIKYFVPIQPIIEPRLIVFALGLSAIVGFIFGTGPAIKASRAEVVSALQTDHT